MNCKICNSTLDRAGFCSTCGFDEGLDYEQYPTLFDAAGAPSLPARRKAQGSSTHNGGPGNRQAEVVQSTSATDAELLAMNEKIRKTKRIMLVSLVVWIVFEALFLSSFSLIPAIIMEAGFWTFVVFLVKFIKAKRKMRKR